MKKAIRILALVLIVAAIIAYMAYYNRSKAPQPLRTTGTVEGIETNISSKVPGKLVFIGFREGQAVKAGELVASLENIDLEASLRQSRAALLAEQDALTGSFSMVDNARAEQKVEKANIESSRAELAKAQSQLAQSEKDLKREAELFKRGIVSRSDYETQETLRDTRKADVDAADAALTLAKSRDAASGASLMKAERDVKTQAARVEQAKDTVDYQQAKLNETKIYSPVDAVVEYRSMEEGEVVSPGQSILTLIDLKNLWVRIDLEQGFITRVKVGQKAEITLEHVPGKVIEGTVFDIGREGEFAVERDVTRGRQDIKTFRTRIRFNDPEGILKPGMTVLVELK
ncbi:MAG: efflux RND transporter periplasmic adaptor subunit [Nitrospirota bacterium]